MNSKFLKHLKFLSISTNQHGVHSPFVFNYLTKCLYQKTVYRKSKTVDVLLKSISYFEYKKFEIIGNENIEGIISQKIPDSEFDQHPIDLIFVEKINPNLLSGFLADNQIHNDSMVLINSIYKNKGNENHWNQIIKDERATVTLDFFYCGAIFFRKEQVKEHFRIRL